MTSDKKTRRRYSELKNAQVLAECSELGASVAEGGDGPRHQCQRRSLLEAVVSWPSSTGLAKTSKFISLALPASTESAAVAPDVRVELRRGPVSITVTWPVSAAAELAAWTRELLR
jgi:transposase